MSNALKTQYKDDKNLNARIALHAQFSTNLYPWCKWAFDRLDAPKNARILEIGCGPGNLWKENLDRIPAGWDITLTDFSAGMLASAEENLADSGRAFTFKVANAQDLSFEDDVFDTVIANHMLYHVPDRARAFAEIRRVLKPDGKFFAATNGEAHMLELWQLLKPYLPGAFARSLAVGGGFTLENGAAQMMGEFGDVQRYDYEDSLRVTDAEAIIAYFVSSNTLMDTSLSDAQLASIRADVVARIQADGAYIIRKSVGMFECSFEG